MTDDKNNAQLKEQEEKEHVKPGDIKGKIEVEDTRERRDGPGGN